MKRILFKDTDGSLSILVPSPAWRGTLKDLIKKDLPAGRPYKIVDETEIPTDRSFRNAWDADIEGNGQIFVQMEKARAIQLERLVYQAEPRLGQLDFEQFQALEIKDDARASELAAEIQALKLETLDFIEPGDLVAAAQTPDELKRIKIDRNTGKARG